MGVLLIRGIRCCPLRARLLKSGGLNKRAPCSIGSDRATTVGEVPVGRSPPPPSPGQPHHSLTQPRGVDSLWLTEGTWVPCSLASGCCFRNEQRPTSWLPFGGVGRDVPETVFSFRNSLEGPTGLRKATLLMVMVYGQGLKSADGGGGRLGSSVS